MTAALVETIARKRNGKTLGADEIRGAVRDYVAGRVPDYQMSALLMAIYFRGMNTRELRDLTRAMIDSGERYDLSAIDGVKVDKHSTGGVGDKVSIALAPLVASAGGIVPMVSGRGLGHTGGTLDKLESIPGFQVRLTPKRFARQLGQLGVVMAGQSARLVPADRKMYALRDVTATVESIPLIAASILSKKIASGNDALAMDVKVGSGAFMPTAKKSRELARTLVSLGRSLGLKVVACLTDMNQPLGWAIGNALEVRESVEVLRGGGPPDHLALMLELGGRMLVLGRHAKTMAEAKRVLRARLDSGAAFERFLAMVEAQGGDPRKVQTPTSLSVAPIKLEVKAARSGYLAAVDTHEVGMAVCGMGAGRQTMSDKIDPGVGFRMLRKIGDPLRRGEPIWAIHARRKTQAEAAAERLRAAVRISDTPVRAPKLIKGTLF